jgi:hypothetical protein
MELRRGAPLLVQRGAPSTRMSTNSAKVIPLSDATEPRNPFAAGFLAIAVAWCPSCLSGVTVCPLKVTEGRPKGGQPLVAKPQVCGNKTA